jgi:tRNA pseudouridine65 synthase
MNFRILYQDDSFVAIDKPAGFHVHPPEDPRHLISQSWNCLYLLRKQLGSYLYPVHRLDRATSGVLLFGLKSETARRLCESFQNQKIKKTYYCVTRGWIKESGLIQHPLRSEHDPEIRLDAKTSYVGLAQLELPESVGKYPTARYSLVQIQPYSGRRHQIRRHMDHLAHPLIGDTVYGSGEHNRFFRERLGIQGLLLKAYSVELEHPQTGAPIRIVSRWNGLWHRVFDLFGFCPIQLGIKR